MRAIGRRLCGLLLVLAACLAAAENSFRFSILGDRTGKADQAVYAQTWAEIDRLRPDFVINVGDTIQGTDDQTAEAEWKEIRGFLARYKRYPFYFVAGNHDIWSDYSRKLFERETGRPPTYSFDYQNAHFVVLDNSRSWELAPDQLQFLEDDLKRNRTRDPKFVFFHQPFWILPVKLRSRSFELDRLAREYGVDYVISGHGHQFVRLELDGIAYVEIGSSGANIGEAWKTGEGFAQGSFYQHALVEVIGPRVKLTVKELDAPYGKGRQFDAEGRGASSLSKPAGAK